MNTASLDLCKELYELSGWEIEPLDENNWDFLESAPKYPLGYLLRKLPAKIDINDGDHIYKLTIDRKSESVWRASYSKDIANRKGRGLVKDWKYKLIDADTPENALCKLAIELFRQGVLKRGE